jgi:hypothetical protein
VREAEDASGLDGVMMATNHTPVSQDAIDDADARILRMREQGHEEPSEEDKQRNLDETLTMMEWSPGV